MDKIELTDGHKKAIIQMYAHGTSIRDLAAWYKTDQETIREVLQPHVKFSWEPGRERGAQTKAQ